MRIRADPKHWLKDENGQLVGEENKMAGLVKMYSSPRDLINDNEFEG